MIPLKRYTYFVYLVIPLVRFFGKNQGALTNAEVKATPVISRVFVRSFQLRSSRITNVNHFRSGDKTGLFGSVDSELISTFSSPVLILPTRSPRMKNVSFEDSRVLKSTVVRAENVQPAVTLSMKQSVSAFTVKVSPSSYEHSLIVGRPTEPASATLASQHPLWGTLTATASTPSVYSEKDVHDEDDCATNNNRGKACDSYVTRWVEFYLNVSNGKNKTVIYYAMTRYIVQVLSFILVQCYFQVNVSSEMLRNFKSVLACITSRGGNFKFSSCKPIT